MAILFRNDCVLCQNPMGKWDTGTYLCQQCVARAQALRCGTLRQLSLENWAASVFYYRNEMAACIKRYKFHGHKQYADFFARELLALMENYQQEWHPDVITYIPLGLMRARERGFNQSKLVAERIANSSSIPCHKLLRKRAWVARQSGTSGVDERFANARDAFAVQSTTHCRGKCVLIIDDVLTTGATLDAAMQALREAGAEQVYAMTIASAST